MHSPSFDVVYKRVAAKNIVGAAQFYKRIIVDRDVVLLRELVYYIGGLNDIFSRKKPANIPQIQSDASLSISLNFATYAHSENTHVGVDPSV